MMAGMMTLILTGLLFALRTRRALVARKPRVAAPTGRPPARRAASTPTNLRPPVLGPAVPPVERLGGCRLHRPTRDRHPLAAVGLQAILDLEELAKMPRPPGRRPGDPSAHSHDGSRHLWGAPQIHGELQKLGIAPSLAVLSLAAGTLHAGTSTLGWPRLVPPPIAVKQVPGSPASRNVSTQKGTLHPRAPRAAAVGCSRLLGRAPLRYPIQAANSASADSSERLRAAARTLDSTQSGKGTSLLT